MTHESVPQRLSDAERDEAATALREHYEAGRLDADEFGQRLDQVLSARVASEVSPAFGDLPAPHPAFLPSATRLRPAPPPQVVGVPQPWQTPAPYAPAGAELQPSGPEPTWMGLSRKLLWPVAIILALITGDWLIWIGVAIVGGIVLSQLSNQHRQPPPSLER